MNNIYSGQVIADYIEEITPDPDNIPYSWLKDYVLPYSFKLEKVLIEDILEMDPYFKEYFDQTDKFNIRYSWSPKDEYYILNHPHKYEPVPEVTHDSLYNPIVISNNLVVDGFSRITRLWHEGETEVEAFVAIDNTIEEGE